MLGKELSHLVYPIQDEIIQRQEAKIKLLEGQVNLLKKADLIERRLTKDGKKLAPNKIFKLIYSIIKENNLRNMIRYFCEILGVSRSGYYSYLREKYTRNIKEEADLKMKEIILKVLNRRGYKKGSRSINMILENEFNIQYSRKQIQKIINKYNIISPHRKSNPYRKIAKGTKEHHVVPNKLNREFKQGIPSKILLDITYLPYSNINMAYLSTIKDASTNEILAYQVSDRITLDIAAETIKKLIKTRKSTFIVKLSFIRIKEVIIQADSIKVCLKNMVGVSQCLKGATAGIILHKNHFSVI